MATEVPTDSPAKGKSLSKVNGDDLIQIVNDLQDKLTASGQSLTVSLPQIVVVGCQSAGKSSVLENIVGREFLPRGAGIVTRRPTIVQLNPFPEEYAIFLHRPEEKITDFEEIKREIQKETLRDPGPTGFSSTPINLQIYSPNVLKLTLVDLPGLVKNPVGDQSENVVDEVREMVLNYISQPKCLILAVSPANQDLANSDSLNIAKLVDPERERTIGVLTKLDLMDKGTHACDILENKVVPLKRGYVGVINRSQQDIDEKKDIEYSLTKERRFFLEQPQYRHLSARMGTKYLQTLLHRQLKSHIHTTLPEVRNELDSKYTACKRELEKLNEKLGEFGKDDKRMLMIKLVNQFVDSLNLKLIGQSEQVDLKQISAGAHINYLIYTEIQEYLNLELVPDQKDLTVVIANISGIRTSISVPSLAFDAVCRVLVEKFKHPLEKSVDTVARVLNDLVRECAYQVKQYPSLQDELVYRLNSYIKLREKVTKDILKSHIEAEMNYINMGHPDFEVSILQQIAPQAGPVKIWDESPSPSSLPEEDSVKEGDAQSGNEEQNSSSTVVKTAAPDVLLGKLLCSASTQKKVDYISALIVKYLEIVRKTVYDLAIKYIMFYFIRNVLNFAKVELVACLLDSANPDSLMTGCEDDLQRQEQLESTCSAISEALDAIRDFGAGRT